jgi:hypothetical protein
VISIRGGACSARSLSMKVTVSVTVQQTGSEGSSGGFMLGYRILRTGSVRTGGFGGSITGNGGGVTVGRTGTGGVLVAGRFGVRVFWLMVTVRSMACDACSQRLASGSFSAGFGPIASCRAVVAVGQVSVGVSPARWRYISIESVALIHWSRAETLPGFSPSTAVM